MDTFNLEETAKRHMWKRRGLFNSKGRQLKIDGLFDQITQSGENAVYVTPYLTLYNEKLKPSEEGTPETIIRNSKPRIT